MRGETVPQVVTIRSSTFPTTGLVEHRWPALADAQLDVATTELPATMRNWMQRQPEQKAFCGTAEDAVSLQKILKLKIDTAGIAGTTIEIDPDPPAKPASTRADTFCGDSGDAQELQAVLGSLASSIHGKSFVIESDSEVNSPPRSKQRVGDFDESELAEALERSRAMPLPAFPEPDDVATFDSRLQSGLSAASTRPNA